MTAKRPTNKKKVLIGAGVAVATLTLVVAFWLVHAARETVANAYAVWWTADLVIEHMESHDGVWPRSWDDLDQTSKTAYTGVASTNADGTWVAEFRPRAEIDELKRRVGIDWTTNPKALVNESQPAKSPPFRVIYLLNGKSGHYQGKEPNQMILDYLQSKQRTKKEAASPLL